MTFPCPVAASENWAIVDCSEAGSDYDVLLVVYMFSVGARTPFDDLTKYVNNFVSCCENMTVDNIHRKFR
jgi:hypothetical protein